MMTTNSGNNQMPNDKKITQALEIYEAVKNEWMMTTHKNLEES